MTSKVFCHIMCFETQWFATSSSPAGRAPPDIRLPSARKAPIGANAAACLFTPDMLLPCLQGQNKAACRLSPAFAPLSCRAAFLPVLFTCHKTQIRPAVGRGIQAGHPLPQYRRRIPRRFQKGKGNRIADYDYLYSPLVRRITNTFYILNNTVKFGCCTIMQQVFSVSGHLALVVPFSA